MAGITTFAAGSTTGIYAASHASLDGDIDIRCSIRGSDYASGATQWLMYQISFGSNLGYALLLDSVGDLYLYWGDGSTVNLEGYDAAFVDGRPYELRVTRDVSTGDVEWYVDGVNVHSDESTPSAQNEYTELLWIGSAATGDVFNGAINWLEIYDGIDGDLYLRYDASDVPGVSSGSAIPNSTTWTGAMDGRTWTVYGSTILYHNTNSLHGDALFKYVQNTGAPSSLELVGALNELNGTQGKEYAEARGTYLGIPPAG